MLRLENVLKSYIDDINNNTRYSIIIECDEYGWYWFKYGQKESDALKTKYGRYNDYKDAAFKAICEFEALFK